MTLCDTNLEVIPISFAWLYEGQRKNLEKVSGTISKWHQKWLVGEGASLK